MEKDFHYHLIYSLTLCAGFDEDEALIIAYSSQFVDDNNEGPFEVGDHKILFPRKIDIEGNNYYPILTQSLSPKSLDFYIQKYVYMPFHFIPGNATVKIRGRVNPYSVEPDSERAKRLLHAAFESKNLYRIGIALHTYADTWSHQNFSAFREDWNSVYPWYNVFKSYVPNIGHAEAGHAPDIISARWVDYRLGEREIDNRERAMDAVEAIFKFISEYRGRFVWNDVRDAYEKIIFEAKGYDHRIMLNAEFVRERFGVNVPFYDKNLWFSEVFKASEEESDLWVEDVLIERKVKHPMVIGDLRNTHWYKFQQAAKAHLALALELVSDL